MHSTLKQSSLLDARDTSSARSQTASGSPGPSRLQSWIRNDKVKIGGSLLLLLAAAVLLARSFGGDAAADASRERLAIDSVTGVVHSIGIVEGDRFPWTNPDTGERTLYPAEKCYWTKDGKAKLVPTYVFVKLYANINEKTTCPDCGREVRQHNPLPPDELLAEAAAAKDAGK